MAVYYLQLLLIMTVHYIKIFLIKAELYIKLSCKYTQNTSNSYSSYIYLYDKKFAAVIPYTVKDFMLTPIWFAVD